MQSKGSGHAESAGFPAEPVGGLAAAERGLAENGGLVEARVVIEAEGGSQRLFKGRQP